MEEFIESGKDPLHAIYTHAQNLLAILVEVLNEIPDPALDRFFKTINAAKEEYQTGGPPMSPLTDSYFTCWLMFDVAVGIQKETLATIIIDLAKQFKDHTIKKEYLAICEGIVEHNKIKIDKPISRNRVDRKKMAVDAEGKDAKPAPRRGRGGSSSGDRPRGRGGSTPANRRRSAGAGPDGRGNVRDSSRGNARGNSGRGRSSRSGSSSRSMRSGDGGRGRSRSGASSGRSRSRR